MTTISLNNDVVTTINTFTVEPQHQQRALELGAHAYLAKPCPQDVLLEIISSLFG